MSKASQSGSLLFVMSLITCLFVYFLDGLNNESKTTLCYGIAFLMKCVGIASIVLSVAVMICVCNCTRNQWCTRARILVVSAVAAVVLAVVLAVVCMRWDLCGEWDIWQYK